MAKAKRLWPGHRATEYKRWRKHTGEVEEQALHDLWNKNRRTEPRLARLGTRNLAAAG